MVREGHVAGRLESKAKAAAPDAADAAALALLADLRAWAQELGFSQIGVAGVDLAAAEPGLSAWLDAGFHGAMNYMAAHGLKRARPAELVPGTVSVITARMDYLPRDTPEGWQAIGFAAQADPMAASVSLYARGRDYHKVLRQRLQRLADRLQEAIGPIGHRVFTDSAPVLEVELAQRSGIGWRGKHTLTLHREGGSMFFLGEIFVDLALPATEPASAHCGQCRACMDVCPTQAIVAPYRLDARRCISYLTIELDGPIPEALRAAIGNRIYGCDDCQLVCPWNKYAGRSTLPDFDRRAHFVEPTLLELWAWDEAVFMRRTEGSAIRRIGYQRWRRNLAVALGNAWRETGDEAVAQALRTARGAATPLVREHIDWALAQRS
jgi:epoxyqueuosine reductase